ncbi:MAG: glutathione S-transferase family protein, partial [Caulobacteraceae bacterium]
MTYAEPLPVITAFAASPDRGRGLARDMRVRWGMAELGMAYDVALLSFAEMKQAGHLARNPFGQIPTYEAGDLVLFETGAILMHVARVAAERGNTALLPADPDGRDRVAAWMFAALNTVEPPILERSAAFIAERDKPWYADRLPLLDERINVRLAQLSEALGEREWLTGVFSAADILMVHAVRRVEATGLLDPFPVIR